MNTEAGAAKVDEEAGSDIEMLLNPLGPPPTWTTH